MTKADIVERVYEKIGLSKPNSLKLVEQVLEIMKGTLERGENLKLTGFGNFVVKKKSDRRGRNPQTGDEVTIQARRVVTFKPSTILKAEINKD